MTCIKCNDRGGFRDGFGRWRKCTCKIPQPISQRAYRQLMLETNDQDAELRRRSNALEVAYARGEINRIQLDKAKRKLYRETQPG